MSKTYLAVAGCMGAVVMFCASIGLSYIAMRYAWGLEVKSWTTFWLCSFGQLFVLAFGQTLSKLTDDL